MNKAVHSSRSPQKRLTSVLDMPKVRAVGGTGDGGTGARNVHHLWAEWLVRKERETERKEEANEAAAQEEEEDWQSAGAAHISFTCTSKASSMSTTSRGWKILGRYLGDSMIPSRRRSSWRTMNTPRELAEAWGARMMWKIL